MSALVRGYEIVPSDSVFSRQMLFTVFRTKDGKQTQCVGQFYSYDEALNRVKQLSGKPLEFYDKGNPLGVVNANGGRG